MLAVAVGNLGSGKTIIAMFFSLANKKEIWSNFEIKDKRYRKLDIPDLFELKDNITVIMDEGYAWIESRVSSSSLNEYISSIIFHTRKTFTDIYLTTPMLSTIDKRFRKQANFIIYCLHRRNFKKDDFRYIIYDKDNKSIKRKRIKYNNAKKYFKLYNTYEKIESHRKKGLEFKILQYYPNRLKKRVIEITELVSELLNGKITHDIVKSIMFDIEIDLNYEPLVYLRLKGYTK